MDQYLSLEHTELEAAKIKRIKADPLWDFLSLQSERIMERARETIDNAAKIIGGE